MHEMPRDLVRDMRKLYKIRRQQDEMFIFLKPKDNSTFNYNSLQKFFNYKTKKKKV